MKDQPKVKWVHTPAEPDRYESWRSDCGKLFIVKKPNTLEMYCRLQMGEVVVNTVFRDVSHEKLFVVAQYLIDGESLI
jgi:hypothetical protein